MDRSIEMESITMSHQSCTIFLPRVDTTTVPASLLKRVTPIIRGLLIVNVVATSDNTETFRGDQGGDGAVVAETTVFVK